MSYEQQDVNFVGQLFNGNDDLLEFLLGSNAINYDTADKWSDDLADGELITNLLAPSDILISDFPNLYRVDSVGATNEMFLGYIIESHFVSQEVFDKEVEKAKEKWKKIFNEDAELQYVTQYI